MLSFTQGTTVQVRPGFYRVFVTVTGPKDEAYRSGQLAGRKVREIKRDSEFSGPSKRVGVSFHSTRSGFENRYVYEVSE